MKVFLESDRLILRQFVKNDLDDLFDLNSDSEVMRYINGGLPTSYHNIKKTLSKNLVAYEKNADYGYWAAIEKTSNKFIGWFHCLTTVNFDYLTEFNLVIGDETALGYRLYRESWNKGFATEGSKAIIAKSFSDLNVSKIISWALIENKASIRVMEKAGLKWEKDFDFTKNQLPNLLASERKASIYGLSKNEFIAKYNN